MKQNLHITYKLKTDISIINGMQPWNEKQVAINIGMKQVWEWQTECNKWMIMSETKVYEYE